MRGAGGTSSLKNSAFNLHEGHCYRIPVVQHLCQPFSKPLEQYTIPSSPQALPFEIEALACLRSSMVMLSTEMDRGRWTCFISGSSSGTSGGWPSSLTKLFFQKMVLLKQNDVAFFKMIALLAGFIIYVIVIALSDDGKRELKFLSRCEYMIDWLKTPKGTTKGF